MSSKSSPRATVVHVRDGYDVYIGRPGKGEPDGKWGNPFIKGVDGTRRQVIAKYQEWLPLQHDLIADIGELKGKRLGCFCKPKACHGDFLASLVND